MNVQCQTCFKSFDIRDTCWYDGKRTCDHCAAKYIKYAFGRKK